MDYAFYLKWLRKYAERTGCEIHAYVLMTNHVHILVTPRVVGGLPRLMQCLGRRYVGYFNSKYEKTGGLWDGRYFSALVDSEAYLFSCHRYIELNPVRAGMVGHPVEHKWSSYRCNALGASDKVITSHELYRGLATKSHQRQEAYRTLFVDEPNDEFTERIRKVTKGGWVIGGEQFAEKMMRECDRRTVSRGWGGDRRSGDFKVSDTMKKKGPGKPGPSDQGV